MVTYVVTIHVWEILIPQNFGHIPPINSWLQDTVKIKLWKSFSSYLPQNTKPLKINACIFVNTCTMTIAHANTGTNTLLIIPLENTLWTPIYTTSDCCNAMGVGLVFEANLATKEHVSHWILQGVCLLLNTNWFVMV